MRPGSKGESPIEGDFGDYRDAFPALQGRIGPYCSYCERRIATNLAIEHIQPKDNNLYPELEGSWDNYLLGCVNCNSTKGKKDVILREVFLPDRDNTFHAFEYTMDGKVQPAPHLSETERGIADRTLRLVGLEKRVSEVLDENGKIVAIDRVSQRMETWLIAELSKAELEDSPTDGMRRQIARTAAAQGYFSIWMKVFEDDTDMRRRFIADSFPATSTDCFDAASIAVSPRPPNHLTDGGKI
jgi:uncharacterized protein (TIGR02646 family)